MSWTRVLLLAIVILLPLIRPAGPGQTALADAALIALSLLTWPILWRARRPLRLPLVGPQWLIWTGSLIATLVSTNTIGCTVTLAQDVYIFVWFLMTCNAIEPEDLPWLGRAWVVTALVQSGLIVLGAFAGVGALANEWGRGVGTFINPNMAASYLVTSFFVYLTTPFPRSRMLRVAGGVLLLVAAVATGSNAGLAALATGLVALLAFRLVNQQRALWPWLGLAALTGTVFCLLVVLSMPSGSLAIMAALSDTKGVLLLTLGRLGKGFVSRANIWTTAWQAFQRCPTGLGPGASRAGLGGELHNDFLSHLVERGALGLIGLLWSIRETFACLWKMPRVERELDRRFPLAVGPLLAGFASTLPFMLTHEILHFRHHWIFLALIFAQAPLSLRIRRRDPAHSRAWLCDPVGGEKGKEWETPGKSCI
ncbi:MAG: O-antigen ligase family protein [Anaerolineae bacterium]|nr:O-antigen ligase family protein [Anaerolineae bacterium]